MADLPSAVFTASDSLGWVYQFWQAKKKDEVNKSEVKIGADELPAVTQLFTEPYMVQFLLQNTLGAWWVGLHGCESLPLEMPYLRLSEDGMPVAGTFNGWPKAACDLKVLDPCCGSGHFLVAAFEVLVRFRMFEEDLSPAEACTAVLRDNLHGLEIDERCTQIAAFALALTAWNFPGTRGYRVLPELHIACSGLAPRAKKEAWLALAGNDMRLRNGMEWLFELFKDAPILGSLIDPTRVGFSGRQQKIGVARFEELRPLIYAAIARERDLGDCGAQELRVVAQGIASAAACLASRFHLVSTNVPYLSRGKQTNSLMNYCDRHYRRSRMDIATVFLERCLAILEEAGTCAIVAPQNWRFQPTYKDLRRMLISECEFDLVNVLGKGAFQTISGEVVNVGLFIISAKRPRERAQNMVSQHIKSSKFIDEG